MRSAVHAARGLVEADDGRRGAGQHHLERQPLALAAGEVARVGVAATREAGRRQRLLARLLARVLVDEVVARVLHQERHRRRLRSMRSARGLERGP